MDFKNWFEKLACKFALKGMSKACDKLIKKGKKFDLNKDDKNDLQEWKEWADKALEQW